LIALDIYASSSAGAYNMTKSYGALFARFSTLTVVSARIGGKVAFKDVSAGARK